MAGGIFASTNKVRPGAYINLRVYLSQWVALEIGE